VSGLQCEVLRRSGESLDDDDDSVWKIQVYEAVKISPDKYFKPFELRNVVITKMNYATWHQLLIGITGSGLTIYAQIRKRGEKKDKQIKGLNRDIRFSFIPIQSHRMRA